MREIKLSPKMKKLILYNAMRRLESCSVTDNEIELTIPLETDAPERIEIHYTPDAFMKCQALVDDFNSEVGWHMLVRKLSDCKFLVHDVLVYPQTVSGSTVEIDEAEYELWKVKYDDSLAEDDDYELFGQAHSHVNFITKPSGKDEDTWQKMGLHDKNLKFYLFQIWNKKGDINTYLYDMEHNLLYTKEDVDIIVDTEQPLGEFLSDAHDMLHPLMRSLPTSSYHSAYPTQDEWEDGWDGHQKDFWGDF